MHLVFQADKDVSAQDTEQDVEDYWKIVLQLKSVEGISCNPSLQVVVKAGFILAQTNAESDRSLSINTGVFTKDRRLLGELTIIDLHAGKQAVCFHDPADHNHRTFPVTKDLKLSVRSVDAAYQVWFKEEKLMLYKKQKEARNGRRIRKKLI